MEQTPKQPALNARIPDAIRPNHASASKSTATPASTIAIIAGGQGLSEKHQAILESRGLDPELIARMGWRTAQNGTGIEIPYLRDGREVNAKFRTIEGEKRFHQVTGAEKCFYNVDALKELGEETLIITEGEMDCVTALQCGYLAVSVPDGAPKEAIGDKNSVKYDYLKDIPKTVNRIILATDSDQPGINLMNDLALRLGKHRCLWVKYPKDCKDLNETFVKHGRKGVEASIATAQFVKIKGLYRLSQLPPKPKQTALHVGIDAISENFRLRKGDLSVVTGIPSHGKTTFINFVAYNMVKNHRWKVCFASFEQDPMQEHRRVFANLMHGHPIEELAAEEIAASDSWIEENISFIVPDDDEDTEFFDMVWLIDNMAGAVIQHNCDMVVIDPWNEIDHAFDHREMSMTQYVGASIKRLKRFAAKYGVHVMVIAHPAKLRKNESGKYPIPSAYDIEDSRHWYNKPDQVLVVHREDETTLLRVAKSRYHYALGKPADIPLRFNSYTCRYS